MLVVTAAAMMVVGGALAVLSPGSKDQPQIAQTKQGTAGSRGHPAGGAGDVLMTTFADGGGLQLPIPGITNAVPGDEAQPTPAPDTGLGLADFSKLFVKGGFGLFVGFAIGLAIRAFIKLAVVITGFYLLTLTILSHAEWNPFVSLLDPTIHLNPVSVIHGWQARHNRLRHTGRILDRHGDSWPGNRSANQDREGLFPRGQGTAMVGDRNVAGGH
tara:strand:+ start:1076 stop:1720 length:645 start_codon:yes stop_codon:yes gene_type:complete